MDAANVDQVSDKILNAAKSAYSSKPPSEQTTQLPRNWPQVNSLSPVRQCFLSPGLLCGILDIFLLSDLSTKEGCAYVDNVLDEALGLNHSEWAAAFACFACPSESSKVFVSHTEVILLLL